MIFDFNKNFKSNVQVISNDFIKRSLPHIKNNKKVKLEDIEFNKMFKIYSEIEHDAFYILTPHFMEKIKKLYLIKNEYNKQTSKRNPKNYIKTIM